MNDYCRYDFCARTCFIKKASGYCAQHHELVMKKYWYKKYKKESEENKNLKKRLREYEKPDEEILRELAELADEYESELESEVIHLRKKLKEYEKN